MQESFVFAIASTFEGASSMIPAPMMIATFRATTESSFFCILKTLLKM